MTLDSTHLKRMRVLLVPDVMQWVMGNKARAIAHANPWIDATICSEGVLRDQLSREPGIDQKIDLVHFTFEQSFCKLGDRFFDRMPCVVAIAHIDDWESIKSSTRADAIMYLSTEWRDELMKRGVPADRLHYLPNGTDTDIFRPAAPEQKTALRKSLEIPSDAFVIGFVAKRSSNSGGGRKGVEMFVDAMGMLKDKIPNLVPLIVGPGWDDVVERFKMRGIQPRWFPFIPDFQSFAKIYQCMDLFWITSRREGGPMILVEAMASEVCCITTPVGMARDIVVDGKNGLLTAFDDAEMLARLSKEMADDPERQRGIAAEARSTIVSRLQWKQAARLAAPLYAGAIKRFAERTGQPVRQDLLATIDPTLVPVASDKPEPYLSAVPKRRWNAIQTAECGHWMHQLATMGATKAAIRVGMRGCAERPFHPGAWMKVAGAVTKHIVKRRHAGPTDLGGNGGP